MVSTWARPKGVRDDETGFGKTRARTFPEPKRLHLRSLFLTVGA
jgi:hypothetical protein